MALEQSARRVKRFGAGLTGKLALALGLLGLVLGLLPSIADLEQRFGLPWLFALRGANLAPPDVVILAINGETTDTLNLPEKPAQWSRALHIEAVNRLSEAGAAVIVFDLFFEESRAQDSEFAAAIAQANNVVLAKKLVAQSEALQSATALLHQAAQLNATFVLPREPIRVDGYWTFKADDGEFTTLPVAALQVFARDLMARLREVMTGLEPALGKDLQAPSQQATVLRRVFAAQPQLLRRALKNIQNQHDWPPRDRQILRALLLTYAGGPARFLNFYGPPRTVTTLPYHQVIGHPNAAADRAIFKGKAVFIGYLPTTWRDYEAIRDDYHTVYSQADGLRLSGVEIAATAFANLFADSDLKPLALSRQMALFGLWGVLVGVLAALLDMRWAAIVLVLVSAGYVFWARQLFGHDQVWLPLIVPLVILSPIAFVSATLFKYRFAKRQREQIIKLAKQFVPAEVLQRSLADAAPAGPQTQLAYGVCLATDVKNYTRLSETLAPQVLANLMNDYFALLNGIIEQHGGTVADLRGDALLALWAKTETSADLRRQACRAALAMRNALDEFNGHADRPKLETRIGLHAGEVAVGTLGARGGHLEFRAVGDIVNTASRVEGLNKTLNTTLLATAEAIDSGDLFVRPLGRFQLAGKSQPLDIVELVSGRAPPVSDSNYSDFASALKIYCEGHLAEAAQQFVKLSQRWPNDGPTQFFVATCRRRLDEPNMAPWDATITIDQK